MPSYNQYIQKLLEIQEEREYAERSAKSQKEIAIEMGLSEADWVAVQEKAAQHIDRAMGFSKHKNWNDAIQEFDQARAIRPDELVILFGLAQAYTQRWKTKHGEDDRDLARKYAVRCLQIDPNHDPSFEIINLLKEKSGFPALQFRNLLIGGLLLLSGFLGYNLAFKAPPSNDETARRLVSTDDLPPKTDHSNKKGAYQSKTVLIKDEEVTIDFLLNKHTAGLEFLMDEVNFSHFAESFTFDFNGNFDLKDIEVSSLRLHFVLYNKKDEIITEFSKEVWHKNIYPVARQGDQLPFGLVEFDQYQATPSLKRIVVSIMSIDKAPGISDYEASDPLPFSWSSERPKNVNIQILARKNTLDFSDYSDLLQQNIFFEITNTGKVPILSMDGHIAWKKKDGTVVSTRDSYLLFNFLPNLRPGQTRIGHFSAMSTDIPKAAFERYELVITKVEF